MRKLTLILLSVVTLLVTTSSDKRITIFIIGDSTAADKDHYETSPERGWGMVLQGCFTENIVVDNHAKNGRSSKSFINEGRWQKVLDKITPGDYVFIQFGHNDEKAGETRHTDPGSTFDDNLRRFVRETREKGGIPVLFNAVVRRNFFNASVKNVDDESLRDTKYTEEKVNSDTLIETHGAYIVSPKVVAEEMNVPFVDANRITHDLEQGMGVEGSRRLHMWYKPGEVASIPDGRHDNTHYNIYGAHVVANLLADAIGEVVPALCKYIRHYNYVVSKQGRGNYMDLQEAVNAVPDGVKTKVLILDGKWRKPIIPKSKKVQLVKYSNVEITP